MGYIPEKHGNLGYVDIRYRQLLNALVKKHKRRLKDEMEFLIEAAAAAEGITVK